ncbi:hypothetical protein TNCT_656921 [Trichonephila clavata]|uniref:Uncharacterized protein n=1 Tax=Trichonephila clavata TaxID=2740835 RepID=A0A8X6FB66_TRICU|nr:hypothetical protein TNCT_656921 [Trichonephila clavata]
MRSIMSMSKIAGAKGQTDSIILESVSQMNSEKKRGSSDSTMPKITPREYFTAKYRNKRIVFERIATAEVYASTVNQITDGAANLLIASRSPDYDTKLSHPRQDWNSRPLD